jgi:tetratricopeptide (TPR) repeat protein
MKSLLTVLILFAVLIGSVNSQNYEPVDLQIIDFTFNGNYLSADSLLEARIKANPQSPKYYAIKSHVLFYTRYFDNTGMNRDSLVQLIVDNAQKAIDVSEELEETADIKFYRGVAFGYKSRINAIRGELWDAYWDVRDSYNYFEEIIEENPEYYDALIGIAVTDYFNATRITGWRSTLAWFLGMSGDRDKALEYFSTVAEKGKLFKPEAKFVNAMMYRFFETDFERATPYFDDFLAVYPDNTFMQNQYRSLQLNKLIQEKGVEYLAENIETLREEYDISNANVLNAIGYNLINNEDLEAAVRVFQINLKLYPEVANCYDSLAEGYMLQGNNEKAIQYYQIAYEKLDADTTITEQFREFLRDGIEERLSELKPS